MTDTIDQQDRQGQTAQTEPQATQEQEIPTELQGGSGQDTNSQKAQTESETSQQSHREGAPTPPAGMEAATTSNTMQEDVSAETTAPVPAKAPSDDGEQKKEKKAWPKTQRGLIILVVVLALVLGFVGGVAGSAVVQLTGVFQQQPEMNASDQGGGTGNQSGQMPEGGQGQMGEAPEGGADGTDGSTDSDDASSDSDTATGSFTA